jgi:hypothetical protein
MSTTAEIKEQLAELIGDLDPAVVPGRTAAAMVTELAAIEKLAQGGRVLLARRVAESRAWEGSGERTAADWMARQAGTSVSEAAGVIETSKQVTHLEGTAAALCDGKLSANYDAFLTAVALLRQHLGLDPKPSADATAEPTADPAPPANTADPSTAHVGPSDETALTDDATLTDDTRTGRAAASPADPTVSSPTPTATPWSGDRTDQASEATHTEAAAKAEGKDGTPLPPPSAPPVPTRLPGGNNTKVIVLIDHTALVRGHTIAGETCEVAGLGPVPASVVRDLLPDAFVAAVIKKGHDIVNVAHLGRGLNIHQRTAIEATGLRCSNLACNPPDHRPPDRPPPPLARRPDHQTRQPADPLCPNCHRKKTHHGWHLARGTGRRRFFPPDGTGRSPSFDPVPSPADTQHAREPVTLFDG